jgi:hypothetical protein
MRRKILSLDAKAKRSGGRMIRRVGFKDMDKEHQGEIVAHLGKAGARRSLWEFHLEFPVKDAYYHARQAGCTEGYVDLDRADAIARAIRVGGEIRPILLGEAECRGADCDEEIELWIEGAHRVEAAMQLELETIPAFVMTGSRS